MGRLTVRYAVLAVLIVLAGICSRAVAENVTPTPEEIRETLRRYNSGLALPVPVQPPKGAAEFNRALALQTKKSPTAAEYKEAARLYQLAVDAGITPAYTNLALLYLEGKGVKKDAKKGLVLLNTASEKNDSQADVLLARLYLLGTDLPKNEKKAEILLARAVKAGNKNAAAMLAEYKEWKKKNDRAMKEYQEVMKKLKAGQGKPGAPQLQTTLQSLLPVLQGYDFIENRPVPLTSFLASPSPRPLLPPAPPQPSRSPSTTAVQPMQIIPDNSKPFIPLSAP